MNQSVLKFCGILFCAFGGLPSAKADFIRSGPIDAPALDQLINKIQRVIVPGRYKGTTTLGQPCQVQIDYSSDPSQPFLAITGLLDLQPSGGEVISYLFSNTEIDGQDQVQFLGEIDRQETQAYALYVNIMGHNGVPSSIQLGLPHGVHGGSRPFKPGDVVPISHITMLPARSCNGLTAF